MPTEHHFAIGNEHLQRWQWMRSMKLEDDLNEIFLCHFFYKYENELKMESKNANKLRKQIKSLLSNRNNLEIK